MLDTIWTVEVNGTRWKPAKAEVRTVVVYSGSSQAEGRELEELRPSEVFLTEREATDECARRNLPKPGTMVRVVLRLYCQSDHDNFHASDCVRRARWRGHRIEHTCMVIDIDGINGAVVWSHEEHETIPVYLDEIRGTLEANE